MSPFSSEAQRRKFGEMVKQGKMSKETFEEWNNATGDKKLPERVPEKSDDRPKWKKNESARKERMKR